MPVYKRGPLGLDLPPIDGLLLPVIVLLLLGGTLLLWPGTSSSVIQARILQNPLFLSSEDSTLMEVTISNPTSEAVYGLPVSGKAIGSNQLSIYPRSQTIPSLGPQESRKLEFVIVPIDEAASPFLPGSYRVDVSTKIKQQGYSTSVTINVER